MADKEKDTRVSASMKIIWNKNGGENRITDTNYDYNGKIGIKYRGNSSYWNSDKKPFALRLQDAAGSKQKASILGMEKDEDWALLAPFNDKSMIRDVLLFDLMRGTLEYVPTGKYCEVVLNGVYQGVYILAARVRQGSGRINISKPTSDSGDGLTGGYHLEIDRNDSPGFYSTTNIRDLKDKEINKKVFYQYKYPDEEDMTTAQKNYIRNRVQAMEQAIAGNNFKDPDTGYRAYMDTLSVMDFFIAQEFSKNVDGYRLSTPLYKYPDSQDKRFKFSIWDFNISMGNADYMSGWSFTGWAYNNNRFGEDYSIPVLFTRLPQDEVFYDNLKKRWTGYRSNRFSNQSITQKIDSLVELLREPQKRNFQIWNRFSSYVWPNYYIASSWDDEIGFVKNWLSKRMAWMDSQWSSKNPNLIPNPDFEAAGQRGIWGDVWISEWTTSGNITLSNNSHSGTYAISLRSECKASQVITALAPGKYTFRAWMQTLSDPGGSITLSDYNKQQQNPLKINIEPNKDWHLIEVKDLEIDNPFMEIVFSTSYRTDDVRMRADDLELIRQWDDPNTALKISKDDLVKIVIDRNNRQLEMIPVVTMTGSVAVEIYTVSGNKLYKGELNSSTPLRISGVFANRGVYIVKMDGFTRKIVF
ncbi:hypothetical protein FACS1894182_06110 [Bacteroidia bacterium]|nr:hypothetical protein FACS1894182_06110 [Bacteroidia bacterium]